MLLKLSYFLNELSKSGKKCGDNLPNKLYVISSDRLEYHCVVNLIYENKGNIMLNSIQFNSIISLPLPISLFLFLPLYLSLYLSTSLFIFLPLYLSLSLFLLIFPTPQTVLLLKCNNNNKKRLSCDLEKIMMESRPHVFSVH